MIKESILTISNELIKSSEKKVKVQLRQFLFKVFINH